jgi:hypothetical protein
MTDAPDQLTLPIAAPATPEPGDAAGRAATAEPLPFFDSPSPLESAAPAAAPFSLVDWLLALLASAFRPLFTREPLWRWADSRRIPLEHGGTYLSRLRPWYRRMQSAFTDPAIREQYMVKSSRAGATEAVLNRIRHMALEDHGNVQLCVGSQRISTEVNRGRLIPSLTALGVFAEADSDTDDIASALIRLPGMVIRISGAYTEAAFRTHAIRFMVLDECDLEGIHHIGKNTLFDLARSRIRGLPGAQLCALSKPTTWGSPFHREAATGTLECQLLPCPHCGTFQELTIDGTSLVDQLRIEEPDAPGKAPLNPPLAHPTPSGPQPLVRPPLGRLDYDHCRHLDGTWDYDRVVAETRYRCVAGCLIDQDAPLTDADLARPHSSLALCPEIRELHAAGTRLTHKAAMVLAARHLRTNPRPRPAIGGGPRSKRSEHISDLISLDHDMTWGHLAHAWLSTDGDPIARGTLYNEHLGLPRRPTAGAVDPAQIAECRAAYARGTIPFRPDVVFVTVDTQDAFFKATVLAARFDTSADDPQFRDLAVVDYGVFALNSDVCALLEKPYPLSPLAAATRLPGDTTPLDLAATYAAKEGIVDARGHRQDQVYQLYHDSGRRLHPSRGENSRTAELRPTWLKPIATNVAGGQLYIIHHYAHLWKHRLYLGCFARIAEIKECTDRDGLDPAARDLPPRIWLPASPADAKRADFEAELSREQLTHDDKWEATGTHDFADCIRLGLVWLDATRAATLARRPAATQPPPNPHAT